MITLLDQGSTTTDASQHTTGTATPDGTTLALIAVGGGSTTAANGPPTSVTGMGVTWTEIVTVENMWVRATLYTAPAAGATAGPLTVTLSGTIQAFHWHLIALDGEPHTPATYVGADQHPTWSLAAPPGPDSDVLLVAVMNSDSATIGTTGSFATLGEEQSTSATNMTSQVQAGSPAQAVGYTTTAAAPRKVGIAIEVAPTATAPTATAWTKIDGQRAPLIERSHTRRTHTGQPVGDDTYTDTYTDAY